MTPPRSGTTSTEGGGDPELARARERMVERQLRGRGIVDERVLAAMAELPRELFVPAEERARAYADSALRIGAGQTISQPWIVAFMAQVLELRGHELVLEVGTGSGYAAAVLSRVCRELVTIERHASLAERARGALTAVGCANVEVRVGDGSLGAPDRAPFAAISVTAAARGAPPAPLLDQLAAGGRLVCPVSNDGGELLVRYRPGGAAEPLVPVRFVRLVAGEAGP